MVPAADADGNSAPAGAGRKGPRRADGPVGLRPPPAIAPRRHNPARGSPGNAQACVTREPPLKRVPRLSGRSSGVEHNLAKVGVEGSNPFARSRFSQENQGLTSGPPGPFLLPRPPERQFGSGVEAPCRKSAAAESQVRRFQSGVEAPLGGGQHPAGLARRATGDHLVDRTETAPRRPVARLAPFVATASTYGSGPRSGLPASRQAV